MQYINIKITKTFDHIKDKLVVSGRPYYTPEPIIYKINSEYQPNNAATEILTENMEKINNEIATIDAAKYNSMCDLLYPLAERTKTKETIDLLSILKNEKQLDIPQNSYIGRFYENDYTTNTACVFTEEEVNKMKIPIIALPAYDAVYNLLMNSHFHRLCALEMSEKVEYYSSIFAYTVFKKQNTKLYNSIVSSP
jgi:hypothetical protein